MRWPDELYPARRAERQGPPEMSLLLDAPLLCYQPALVRRLGLAEAAIVQQLHYWAQRSTNLHDGYRWVYKTYGDWSDEIGISSKAVRGALDRLRKSEIVVAVQSPLDPRDRTLWWRVNYSSIDEPEPGSPSAPRGRPGAATGSSNAGATDGGQRLRAEREEKAGADPREEVPADFPRELRPHAREVLIVLRRVAEEHGAAKVWPRAVARVIMSHPRHPLVRCVHALELWAEDPPRPIKDVVSTYRTFLDKEREMQSTEPLASDGVPLTGGAPRRAATSSTGPERMRAMAAELRSRPDADS